jgi:hypothetical protein
LYFDEGGCAVSTSNPREPRPRWVYWTIPYNTRRPQAVQLLFVWIPQLGLSFMMLVLATERDSVLSRISCVVLAVATAVLLGVVLWHWLAIRWVDRHGKWTEPPQPSSHP